MKKINFNNVIEHKSELPFYKNLPFKIISFLKTNEKGSFSEIIKFAGGTSRKTLRLLNEMINNGLIKFKNGYFFLPSKRKYEITRMEVICRNCNGKIVERTNRFYQRIKNLMEKIYPLRPPPTFIFDQRPVNLDTTIRRAFYLVWRGDVQSKKIAIIGDDDLTSLALGFLNLSKEIVVFEIDKRLVKFLKEQSTKYHLNIKVIEKNVFFGIPTKWRNRFDVFLTDPTPKLVPFTVFLNAGIKLLKREENKVGYLSIYPSHSAKLIDFQKILTKMNLIITDIIPYFTEYEIILLNMK